MIKVEEFDNTLESLRKCCKETSISEFCKTYDFNYERVRQLLKSTLSDETEVSDLLLDDDFEKALLEMEWWEYKDSYNNRTSSLITQLEKARKSFCGIGTRKVKCMLNRSAKKLDVESIILRTILEIEDVNTLAKKNVYYSDYNYEKKNKYINDLIEIFKKENLNYGKAESDILGIASIIYFDYAGYQFSWHSTEKFISEPDYTKKWDGLPNSTFSKLEKLICEKFNLTLTS